MKNYNSMLEWGNTEEVSSMSAQEYDRYLLEMSRRTLAALLAKVEQPNTPLSDILVNALNEIEALQDE